jgi:hypothetical protein
MAQPIAASAFHMARGDRMRKIVGLSAAILLLAVACQKQAAEPVDATPAEPSVSTVDPSGAAPPQPNPNGGDTPVGAAGPGGVSPSAPDAAQPRDPADPGMTAPPK